MHMLGGMIALCVVGLAVATRPDHGKGRQPPERKPHAMAARSTGFAYAEPFAITCPLALAVDTTYWAESLGKSDVITWLVCERKPLTGQRDENLQRKFMVTSNPFKTNFETMWTRSTLPHLRDFFLKCEVEWKRFGETENHPGDNDATKVEFGQCVRKGVTTTTTTTTTTTPIATTTTTTLELEEKGLPERRPPQRRKVLRQFRAEPRSVACGITVTIQQTYFDENGLGGPDRAVRLVCGKTASGHVVLERAITVNPFRTVYRTQRERTGLLEALLSKCRVLWRHRKVRTAGEEEEEEQEIDSALVEIVLGQCTE